ncbi:MAG: protein phosphatase 2C domain-containing protein [bacterium]|nr:protein phosphatase 2C domain-containing protein [bacterium]
MLDTPGTAVTAAVHISQIHLIDERTSARTVIHIGSSVRGSEREIALEGALPAGANWIPGTPNIPTQKIVRLRFTQVNPRDYDAPIVVELADGDVELAVDQQGAAALNVTPGLLGAPLRHNSLLKLDDHTFRCELLTAGRIPPPRLQVAYNSVIGPVQDHNEDALGIYPHRKAQLFVLADGVGGAEAGEKISEYAVKWLLRAFHQYVRTRDDEEYDWQLLLASAFRAINADVRHFGRLSSAAAGTTLTAVILYGWDAYIAHVGDSRLYQWNTVQLRQVTHDHVSVVTEKTLRGTHKRSVLMKAIGKADTVEPDIFVMRVQPDDRLILCSDGVYKVLGDAALSDLLQDGSLSALPDRMINAANERYNNDNLSVIAVRALPPAPGASRPEPIPIRSLPKVPRVYLGYQRSWRLRLKAAEEIATHPGIRRREQIAAWLRRTFTPRRVIVGSVVAILALVIVYGAVLPTVGWVNQVFQPPPSPTRTLDAMFFNTPVRTPTPVPTVTPLPTLTDLPPGMTGSTPTVTLPPFPTITLPPDFRLN